MFIQSAELVAKKMGDISRINVYGQEKDAATYRLAKMNLALRGISHSLARPTIPPSPTISTKDSTFYTPWPTLLSISRGGMNRA